MKTQTQWPTPTGEPARNHQALKLAHVLKNYLPSVEALEQAGDMLSRQHALIVQMREALPKLLDESMVPLTDFRSCTSESIAAWNIAHDALTAANDYLKGQP